MAYLTELRSHWRPLLGAMIGLGSGFSLLMYTTSIFAPKMLDEFGWTKAEFALVNSLSIIMVAAFPIVGRITDMMGVRRTALIGVLTLPFTYIAYSLMTGDIRQWIGIFMVQTLLCVTTTATVYSRVIVEYFRSSIGLALAVAASGPAVAGAIGGPLLNMLVEAYGWRVGYQALALFSLLLGILALVLIPSRPAAEKTAAPERPRAAREDYAALVKMPAFWTMAIGLLLCNMPQVVALSQLKLILIDNGVSAEGTSVMISAFAIGMLVGRLVSGVALDRYPARIVSAIGLGLPSIGLFLIASPLDTPGLLTFAVLLIGLSYGAEGDVMGFLVVRIFGRRIYSSVLGIMTAVVASAASIGAIVLSVVLVRTGGFDPFLIGAGIAVVIGAFLFLLLPPGRADEQATEAEPTNAEKDGVALMRPVQA